MVSADVMDMIDHKLRIARGKDTPFGGCQMVVFGDLYQLPPVIVGDTAKHARPLRYNFFLRCARR